MKNASAALLTLLLTLCIGCSCLAQALEPKTPTPTLRKPFISLDAAAENNEYKRFKRQIGQTAQQFQDFLTKAKFACASDLDFKPEHVQKSMLYVENPTPQEKCLIECILKRTDVMTADNKLSSRSIGRIAEMVSNNNPLVVSIAVATAENCNKSITATEACEAAYQINKCMANEMRAHKIKIIY